MKSNPSQNIAAHGIRLISSKEEIEQGEGGPSRSYLYELTGNSGRIWKFRDRNIFDFGRVVNPAYAITEGRQEGGLVNIEKETGRRYWMDYQEDVFEMPPISYQGNGLPEGWEVRADPAFQGYGQPLFPWLAEAAPDLQADYEKAKDHSPDPAPNDICGTRCPGYHRYGVWAPPPPDGKDSFFSKSDGFVAGHATPEAAIRFALHHVGFTPDTARIYSQRAGWVMVRYLEDEESAALDWVYQNGEAYRHIVM